MNLSVLANNGDSVRQSLRNLRGNRTGVVAALFATLFFLVGCGGSSKKATPTPSFTPAAGTYTTTQHVTVSDTNQNSVLYCTNDGSTPTASSPQCANPITVSQSQTIRAIAIAPGANASAIASAAYTIGAAAPTPTVTSVIPSSGPAMGGSAVTITGTNFTGATEVDFGTSPATGVTVNSATSITAVSPAGTGSVNVTVVTPQGRSATTTADLFTYTPVPVINSLSPVSGIVGTPVTITGTGFGVTQGSSTVTFAGTAAPITKWSSTSIVAAVPLGAATGNVVVTVNSVQSAGVQFTVLAAPAISSINPSSGVAGAAVTIEGTNFGATAGSVTFNGIAATIAPGGWTSQYINVTVPSGLSAGAATVQVTTTANQTASTVFTVTAAAPTISSITPSSGAAGDSVVISGSGFGSAPGTVYFGTTQATVTSGNWSDGKITTTVPTGLSAGSVSVTVKTATSQSASIPFTVNASVTISSITPSSGAVGDSVIISGSGFGSTQGTGTVSFGGKPATVTSGNWSDSSITTTVPSGLSGGSVNVVVTTSQQQSATTSFTVIAPTTLTGVVVSGPNSGSTVPVSAKVYLYAAGITGYGTGPQPIDNVQTDAKGAFSIVFDCSTLAAPGDQLYLEAIGTSSSSTVLMTALGSCASVGTSFPNGVTINEATTIASAFALAGFANLDKSAGIDVGAPATYDATKAPKCDAKDNWQSTGPSTCNYIGLQNAFATVRNLVDIPSGQVLAITPAYCTSAPCITATTSNTTPYYNTSIVPQGRINAMANALAACVNPPAGSNGTCGTLFAATSIQASQLGTPCDSANQNTPADTLQAALDIAHFPGDRSLTACGVDVRSSSGIYSLIPAANQAYQPTLTSSTAGNTTTDLALALIFQGGGLGAGLQGGVSVAGTPEATGLAIDAGGNIWVPTMSSTNGSLAVFNNQGAPLTASGTSITAFGGYTTGVFNPQSIAIDQSGNAWIGNSPKDGNHGQTDNGSLSEIQLSGSSFTTVKNGLTGATLLTPAPYGVAIDATGNPWLSSFPGGTGNDLCLGRTYGGSILEFDSSSGSVLNGPGGYLNYNDNSSCPTAIAFDGKGYLWVYDNTNNSGQDQNLGLLQLSVSSSTGTPGNVAAGPYNAPLQNPAYSFCSFSDPPYTTWNLAIDHLGDSWFSDGGCMDLIPNLTLATPAGSSGPLGSGSWGAALEPATAGQAAQSSATIIDGNGNAWAVYHYGLAPLFLIGYSNSNATTDFSNPNAIAAMLSPSSGSIGGFEATDPSANASGRAGGTYALGGAYCLDGSSISSPNICPNPGFISLGADGSGNLWLSGAANDASGNSNLYGSQLTEFIGLAVPAQTPLATALTNQAVGQKP